MKDINIFVTGGQVSGESLIGYKDYQSNLSRMIEQKINSTGGIYINGLYRMGKTSVVKKVLLNLKNKINDTIVLYFDLNLYNTNTLESYTDFLDAIVHELKDELNEFEINNLTTIETYIGRFEEDEKSSQRFRNDFFKIFRAVKKAGLNVLLVIDEFDSAREIFKSKADFELFREIVTSNDYSVCIVTVSRQELSLIENENPNNSSFKGVMYPFQIKGFDQNDKNEYFKILKEYYEYDFLDDDKNKVEYYAGSSPYLWSCIGYEIAERKLCGKDVCIDSILNSHEVISRVNGFYDSIFKCLMHDKDKHGISFADKLISIIIGPSFLATDEDIRLLTSMNYFIDTGEEYIPFSRGFKKYLIESAETNNDILNNFSTLEKKLKLLLENYKFKLFAKVNTTSKSEDDKWFDVLSATWQSIEGKTFKEDIYKGQIKGTFRNFGKTETVLNVMSLEDVTRIIRNNWYIFSSNFDNELLEKWEDQLIQCGKARNPVHHGSSERLYTREEQLKINASCQEIIKKIS